MPLVPAICTQCGARLDIDSTHEAALCPYCHTPFVTEKAINNYNTSNITNIKNLHANVVNISDKQSLENRIKAGETFLIMNDYYSAYKIFDKFTEECPYDYRGWWGLIKVYSQNFTNTQIALNTLSLMEEYFEKASTVASTDEISRMSAQYRPYYDASKNILDSIINATQSKIDQLSNEFHQKKSDLEHLIQNCNNTLRDHTNKKPTENTRLSIAVAIFAVFTSIYSGITEGILMFFASLLVFLPILCGLTYAATFIHQKKVTSHDNKTKELEKEISYLNSRLYKLSEEHAKAIEPLNEIINKATTDHTTIYLP